MLMKKDNVREQVIKDIEHRLTKPKHNLLQKLRLRSHRDLLNATMVKNAPYVKAPAPGGAWWGTGS
jgi:hypothetical protein